jgi:hypothetical protein
MKPELQKQLFEKYPKLFGQKDLPMTQTCMCWGIDCGDGWYWLIDRLCSAVQQYCDSQNEGIRIRNEARERGEEYLKGTEPEEEWQVEATQVKEKYGSLRFYTSHGDDETYGMIRLAESMSHYICESCGSLENVETRSTGWIFTLCDDCWKKKQEGKLRV